MKKKALFMVCLCGFATMAVAQSAREEIRQNPALAAGKYYAYQAPDVVLTPAPTVMSLFMFLPLHVMAHVT